MWSGFVSGRILGGRASSSFQVGWVGWMLTWVDGIYVTFGVFIMFLVTCGLFILDSISLVFYVSMEGMWNHMFAETRLS
jgi:hypothetical protein